MKRYAIKINSSGSIERIGWPEKSEAELEWMQKQVGGYIETVSCNGPIMIINEEGKINRLPVNTLATMIYGMGDFIAGNTLLVKKKGSDLVGLNEPESERVIDLLMAIKKPAADTVD